MYNKYFLPLIIAIGIMTGLIAISPAFAQMNTGGRSFYGKAGMHMQLGIWGTVSAVNGTTLTVTDTRTNTVYSVDSSNATVEKNGGSSSLSAVSVGDTVVVQGTISGTSVTAKDIRDGAMGLANGRGRGVFGTVASINGATLTVTAKMGMGMIGSQNNNSATTYIVDASNAKVTKNNTASSLMSIAVGDTVMIQGTINGTNIAATNINDGQFNKESRSPPSSIIQGNGQPVIAGSVTAINGSSLTVVNKSNVSYAVDATNAKVEKANTTSSISSVAVGDNVIVQGTFNGTSVTATSIVDQGAPANNTQTTNPPHPNKGFFGGIFNFFKNLFGF